jgi:predicted homoserine dehydrogenase-like protein
MKEAEEIRVAITGAGAMGKGIAYQCQFTPGVRCVGLADIDMGKAMDVASWLGYEPSVMGDALNLGRMTEMNGLAVTEDAKQLAVSPEVDVFIDATSSISEAGQFCELALKNGKHVIMMNAEADLIFGPYFLELAQENGVVYTSSDGDQHGVIKRIVDEIRLWGFELVMAGNIKGFLDRKANPVSIAPEAEKRRLDCRMTTAYTDGTKLCVEMALLANALGLGITGPGMTGPRLGDVREVQKVFDFLSLWEGRKGIVDYILGAEPGGGVFVIGYCENEYQRFMMNYYKMGEGPFYLFYRPYHLCHVEVGRTILEASRMKKPLLTPSHGFLANVNAFAKKALSQGTELDGIGGFSCYGLIESAEQDKGQGIPICLAENMVLKRDIPEGEKITWEEVDYDQDRVDIAMYRKALACSEKMKGNN